jgi:lysophospholipase L1-like esterase
MVKRLLLFTLWLACVASLLELSCWGFCTLFYKTLSPTDAGLESAINSIPQEDIGRFIAGQYDADLGWSNGPGVSYEHEGVSYKIGRDRVRINPYQSSHVRISAYGDSFTFGDEAENDETFPFFLSQLTQSHVINYGVSAYGTDQSLKRLEKNLKIGKRTDVVVLEFIQDSIKRNMNMYLVFKYGFEKWTRFMFKPMLHEGPDGYHWLENPLKKLKDTRDILAAYEIAKDHDWFYQHPHPVISFPYSLSAVKTLMYSVRLKYEGSPDWGHKASENKMKELIKIYLALAQKHGFVPVIVYIPLGFEIKEYFARGHELRFNTFLAEIAEEHQATRMIVIDLAKEIRGLGKTVSMEQFYVRPYDGHPSAYGNKIIAEIIYKNIKPIL